jgi:putative addiction module component (TIGR02574 family)
MRGASPDTRTLGARLIAMSTDEVLVEALRLSRRDRARVAEELLSSLEEPDDQVAAAWAVELERRSRDVAEGRVQTVDWETARAEILKELDERRARRTAR